MTFSQLLCVGGRSGYIARVYDFFSYSNLEITSGLTTQLNLTRTGTHQHSWSVRKTRPSDPVLRLVVISDSENMEKFHVLLNDACVRLIFIFFRDTATQLVY